MTKKTRAHAKQANQQAAGDVEYVRVPVEPTDKQLYAAVNASFPAMYKTCPSVETLREVAGHIYVAMVEAEMLDPSQPAHRPLAGTEVESGYEETHKLVFDAVYRHEKTFDETVAATNAIRRAVDWLWDNGMLRGKE